MSFARREAMDQAALESLGFQLRQLRKAKAFSIAQLAVAADVPVSTISKIENGVLKPSLVNAINLATALDSNLGFLVDQTRKQTARYSIVRKSQRSRREFSEMSMVLEDMNVGFVPGLLEARVGTLSPAAHSGSEHMTHPGEEFTHVLSGQILYDIDGVHYRLSKGDSLHFKSDTPHRWVNDTERPATILWVFSDGLSF
ncbi:helix-turn-helix transcriptional regulator [Rhizobium sp. ARZ01]|uniref:helix-turn-helix domain-containing protein n=1 Tax=Rhizobium sp. ARZ01 TaxID=2769313 RepID=UPI001781DC5B|nr:XRE family transcriptional regulator [Rhizobium sp. ARZ01]MBD9375442.1 helix-turn-helix transcriptional regulator [Rhizobium sp. ARZ01]